MVDVVGIQNLGGIGGGKELFYGGYTLAEFSPVLVGVGL